MKSKYIVSLLSFVILALLLILLLVYIDARSENSKKYCSRSLMPADNICLKEGKRAVLFSVNLNTTQSFGPNTYNVDICYTGFKEQYNIESSLCFIESVFVAPNTLSNTQPGYLETIGCKCFD